MIFGDVFSYFFIGVFQLFFMKSFCYFCVLIRSIKHFKSVLKIQSQEGFVDIYVCR